MENKQAIVTVEKLPFNLEAVKDINGLVVEDVKLLDENDVYSWSVATIKQD